MQDTSDDTSPVSHRSPRTHLRPPPTHHGCDTPGTPGHDKHAGHDPEMFRRRFWLSLLLTIPLVVTSEMVMDWFGYELDFPAIGLVGPVLGSFVFWLGRLAVPGRRRAPRSATGSRG